MAGTCALGAGTALGCTMDVGEECAEELEAMCAIFGDDYELLQDSGEGGAKFNVRVRSDQGVSILLCFQHVSGYPDAACIVATVRVEQGLRGAERTALQRALNEAAINAVGAPSAFVIVEAAREWLDADHPADDHADDDNRFETVDAKARAAVEVIAAKAIGTPVTAESFAQWHAKFVEEMRLKRGEGVETDTVQKMTGRAMFEARAVNVVNPTSESFWEAAADAYDE